MAKLPLLTAMAFASCVGAAVAQSPAPASGGDTQKGFVGNISDLTEENANFRRVIYTGKKMQLSLMSLKPGEDIGEEVHDDVDQFFRIEAGNGEVVINGNNSPIKTDDAILVPAGASHNVKNTGTSPLRLYTIYAPPEHKDKTLHVTKQDGESKKAHFDGKTTE